MSLTSSSRRPSRVGPARCPTLTVEVGEARSVLSLPTLLPSPLSVVTDGNWGRRCCLSCRSPVEDETPSSGLDQAEDGTPSRTRKNPPRTSRASTGRTPLRAGRGGVDAEVGEDAEEDGVGEREVEEEVRERERARGCILDESRRSVWCSSLCVLLFCTSFFPENRLIVFLALAEEGRQDNLQSKK